MLPKLSLTGLCVCFAAVTHAADYSGARRGFLEPLPLFTEIEDDDANEVPTEPLYNSVASLQSSVARDDAGVVCASFLNPSLQQNELALYLLHASVSPEGFATETKRLCAEANFPVDARPAYNGSWAGMQQGGADITVLEGLGKWVKEQVEQNKSEKLDWGKFSKPNNGRGAGNLIHHVATTPSNITIEGDVRLLDFGCGSGQDLAAAKEAFGATKDNSFCLDVFKVAHEQVTPYTLDAASEEKYKQSLETTLSAIGEGTVHIAFSMVTFHHIRGAMRSDAISFVSKVLAPGGIFILAEWDNTPRGGVQNREVYFDLVHFLPTVLFNYKAPPIASSLSMNTKYLSLPDRRAEMTQSGLVYDAERSKIVQDGDRLLTPEEMAASDHTMNRDFYLVLSKSER